MTASKGSSGVTGRRSYSMASAPSGAMVTSYPGANLPWKRKKAQPSWFPDGRAEFYIRKF